MRASSIPAREKLLFTRQLATLLHSGLPLSQSLKTLAAQPGNPRLKDQLHQLDQHLQDGKTLAGALKRFPATFDPLYVSLIELGELTGTLTEALYRLTLHLESVARLQKQIVAAMLYPAIVCIIGAVVSLLMVFRVVPIFEQMFATSGATLPPPTLAILVATALIRTHAFSLLVLILGLGSGALALHRTPRGRRWLDQHLLKVPVLGELLVRISMARYARTLSTLVASGVGMLKALEAAANTFTNQSFRDASERVRSSVVSGKTLHEALHDARVFPVTLVQLVRVGESTGELEHMLMRAADYYDEEVETGVKALVALLEPTLMIFLGVMVGGVLLALYLPIFTLTSTIGQS